MHPFNSKIKWVSKDKKLSSLFKGANSLFKGLKNELAPLKSNLAPSKSELPLKNDEYFLIGITEVRRVKSKSCKFNR